MTTRNVWAVTLLTVVAVPGLFRDLETGDRQGQLVALALCLALGASAAGLSRSPWPFLGTVAMCLFMLYLRERRGVTGRVRPAVIR